MSHSRKGIENAVYAKSQKAWHFHDDIAFWANFVCDPDALAPGVADSTIADDEVDEAELAELEALTRQAEALMSSAEDQLRALAPKPASPSTPAGLDPAIVTKVDKMIDAQMGASGMSGKEAEGMRQAMRQMYLSMYAKMSPKELAEVVRGLDESTEIYQSVAEERDIETPESQIDVYLSGGNKKTPDPAQVEAYRRYVQSEKPIGEKAVAAIYRYYTVTLPKRWGSEEMEYLPKVRSAQDLKLLVQQQAVTIHPPDRKGQCDIGLAFACGWDDEHGLGVLIRAGEIVDVGYADVADAG